MKRIVGLVPPKNGTVTFQDSQIQTLQPQQIVKRGIRCVPEGRHGGGMFRFHAGILESMCNEAGPGKTGLASWKDGGGDSRRF